MPAIAEKLTLAEFESQYRGEKPYYEYWCGEAVQKSMPNWIHGLLQVILSELLARSGFKAAAEVRLKIDLNMQFLPDVIATRSRIESLYPVTALEIVIEILSEDDSMSRMLTKCRKYQEWGFEQILVVDPTARIVFCWSGNRLEAIDEFAGIPTDEIWSTLDRQLSASPG